MEHRRARTDAFAHTIAGLLEKRIQLHHEAERIRDRQAEIKNDVHALDRVLGTLGYEGDLDATMPRQKRDVLFGKGELTRACQASLRAATTPVTSRQIAQDVLSVSGMDARDRKLMNDLVKRVGKAMRVLADKGRLQKATDGNGKRGLVAADLTVSAYSVDLRIFM